MRSRIADDHGIGLSDFNARPDADRDAAVGLRLYDSELCSECKTHPSVWDVRLGGNPAAVRAVWRHCRVCEVLEQARKAGPPDPDTPGWHLELEHGEGSPHVHEWA